MSVFDRSFSEPSHCFGISSAAVGDRQSTQLSRLLEDDLKTATDRQRKQEMDGILSNALKALTFEEREEQYEILHGIEQKIAEEEKFIETSLEQLEHELSQIKQRTIYEMAEQMDSAYVRARSFRVMFLRAHRYDAKAAADNMIRFFVVKYQLFGRHKLAKDITLEDLDEGDIAALKSGAFQKAGRDMAGRLIALYIPGLRGDDVTLQNELRMRYYLSMSVLEKEENQLSSFVTIRFSVAVGDMRDKFGAKWVSELAKLSFAIPAYMAAAHLCTDEVGLYLFQLALLKAAPVHMRSRMRLHFGSQTECLYELSTYGIPEDFLPIDPKTNQISLKRHLEWVESRFSMERRIRPIAAISGTIVHPGDKDVLVGNGKMNNNQGNLQLRSLVKDLSQAYNNGSIEVRRTLVDRVIHSIEESGGRFLKQEPSWDVDDEVWKAMPKEKCRKIVAQAFRNSYRRRSNNKTTSNT